MSTEDTIEPDFAIEVRSIAGGSIQADLRVGPHHLELWMDSFVSVSPEDLACWVLALKRGETATLMFDWVYGFPTLSGIPIPDSLIKLSASRHLLGGSAEKIFDCLVSIEHAISGVRVFLQAVEQHPHLASSWLFRFSVPEALEDEAEMCWQEEVSAASSPEDMDAQDAFEARYIAERMQFTPEQLEDIERYRAKLVAAADSLR